MKPLDAEQGAALAKLQTVAFASGRAEERAAIVADGLREVAQHPGADGWFNAWLRRVERGEHLKGRK